MTRWVEMAGMVLLVVAGAMALVAAWKSVRWVRGGRGRCVGVTGAGSGWFRLVGWLIASRCGYDLRGTPEAGGVRVCPECGTRNGARRARVIGWVTMPGVRLGAVAALLAAVGVACHGVRWFKRGDWAEWAPTVVLLAVEDAIPRWSPYQVRKEITARRDGLNGLERWWLRRLSIESLGNDEVQYNGEWAAENLRADFAGSREALIAVLGDEDWQRRDVAAWILIRELDPKEEPPPGLVKVAVEGLQDDGWLMYSLGNSYWNNGRDFLHYLRKRMDAAERELRAALESGDWQQRLLAAAVLTLAERGSPEATRLLCASLGDNTRDDDAVLAFRTLWDAGPGVLPELEAYHDGEVERGGDAQGRLAAELLIRKLRGEPVQVGAAKTLNQITWRALDPTDLSRPSQWFGWDDE